MVTSQEKNKLLSDLMMEGIAGNQYAYAQFLAKIIPYLRPIIAKKITSADAEDVLQEVLISIHKARHTYDSSRPILPWIISITKFRVTDHLRKHYLQRRDKTYDLSEYENILEDVTNDTSDSESIDELLSDLAEKNKKILTMMYMEGYTAREVGSFVGMKESAVKVAAHRAIKKIRTRFKI